MVGVGDDLYAFSVMILAGAGLGLSFDLYRALFPLARPRGRARRQARFVLDLVYGLGAGVWLAGWMVVANWAQGRWYVFAGVLLGTWTYFYLGSPLVRRVLGAFRRGVGRLVRLVRPVRPPGAKE